MTGGRAAALLLTLEDLPPGPWLELPPDVGPDGGAPAGGAGEALLAACLGDGFDEASVVEADDSARFVRPAAAMAFASAFVFSDASTAADAATQVASPAFAEAFAHAVAAGSAESEREQRAREAAAGASGAVGNGERRGEVIDVQVSNVGSDVAGVRAVHRATITGGDVRGLVPIHVELAVLSAADVLVLVWLADTPDAFPSSERELLLGAVAARLPE